MPRGDAKMIADMQAAAVELDAGCRHARIAAKLNEQGIAARGGTE